MANDERREPFMPTNLWQWLLSIFLLVQLLVSVWGLAQQTLIASSRAAQVQQQLSQQVEQLQRDLVQAKQVKPAEAKP